MSECSKIISRSILTTFFVLLTFSCGVFPSGGEEKPGWTVTPRVAKTGEPITFTLTNTLASIITLPSSAPWHVIHIDTGDSFYPGTTTGIILVDPGVSKEWVWDQKDNFNNQMPTGNYAAYIDYYLTSGDPPRITGSLNSTSTTFVIE